MIQNSWGSRNQNQQSPIIPKEETEQKNPILIERNEPGFIETADNRIYFYTEIERDRILQLIRTLKIKSDEMLVQQKAWSLDSPPPIYLHVQSYGGSAHSGLAGHDHIVEIKKNIPVYTIIDGVSASAATFLTIAGTKRFIHKHAFTLIHQLSTCFWGTYEELKDVKQNCDTLMKIIKNIYAEFTKVPVNILEETLKRDVYFTAKESVKYGIVDEIIGE
jgi:ATP-dependent Clp endopeptidase proteolytic subunit ClpP